MPPLALDQAFDTAANLEKIVTFVQLARCLKDEIVSRIVGYAQDHAPSGLPDHISTFISQSLRLSIVDVKDWWCKLREIVWSGNDLRRPLTNEELAAFARYGPALESGSNRQLGICMFLLLNS